MDEKSKRLAFAIVEFLNATAAGNSISDEEKESLEVAAQCVQDVFKIDVADPAQQKLLSPKPATLASIFDVYLATKAKKAHSASSAAGASTSSPSSGKPITEEDKKRAEELKAQGNKLVAERKFADAITKYTQAIQLNPANAVYYSNRAAAYSQQNDHDAAIEDALKAADLDPSFSKAYSRLGHAYYATGRFAQAADAYAKGLELDPTNATMKQALARARAKAPQVTEPQVEEPEQEEINTTRSAPGGAAGMGGGGMPDLASMLNNPALMNMAQSFLGGGSGGAGAGGAGRGAGGAAPGGLDIASLLNNPAMMQMAQQAMQDPNIMNSLAGLMGGAGLGGGAAGAGRGRGRGGPNNQ